MHVELRFVGADAIMLYFGHDIDPATSQRVQLATDTISSALEAHIIDLVPAYASLLVLFDPLLTSHTEIARRLRELLAGVHETGTAVSREIVVLPVFYASQCGPDLEVLAADCQLTVDEVIALHSGAEYRVYAIGFAPGFAYLGEVDPRIARPRHPTPRPGVPAGSVAIADRQTAVYPAASPGGWNLIGRCPVPMFNPHGDPLMPVAVGDRVRFRPIDQAEYLALGGELS